jgi:S-adenosylmethionine:tRNA ribosyltransferase-isomerase
MRLEDLQYDLPEALIAQQPAEPRDSARLLVLNRATGTLEHRIFRDLPTLLDPGDTLVVNDTKVIPARFFCQRASGGKIEALFIEATRDGWEVLLKPSRRLSIGEALTCPPSDVQLRLVAQGNRGAWLVQPEPSVDPLAWLPTVGAPPLPPYIRRDTGPAASDTERYQTVYAETPGAVAAPTAGLHFTDELFQRLSDRGVARVPVTLHVGIGTFQPVEVDDLREHQMHAERYAVAPPTITALQATRAAGRRVVAVGTTSTRVLESLPPIAEIPTDHTANASTEIFIYPPYDFRNVDALITNFHLPGSTLIAMVMAFAGIENIRRAYAAAVAERYRFYSYGDAMLIV